MHNTWSWDEPHETVTLHMLNHMKLLQSNVFHSKPMSIVLSRLLCVTTLYFEPFENKGAKYYSEQAAGC